MSWYIVKQKSQNEEHLMCHANILCLKRHRKVLLHIENFMEEHIAHWL